MKVLLISTMDSGGGAAIAATRLCNELNNLGIDTTLMVEYKKTDSPYVGVLPSKKGVFFLKVLRQMERYLLKHLFKTSNRIDHSLNFISTCDISWINSSDYDIVNIHYFDGTINLKQISKINKPVIFTMHDSWICCGAEHHPNILENDERYKQGYYKWNKPKSTKGLDFCRYVWEYKLKWCKNKNYYFIAPSRWESNILRDSSLFNSCQCETIPNILPLDIFYPKDKHKIRMGKGIPVDKNVIGFGAAYDIKNTKSMKGTHYLLELLNSISNKNEFYLVLFGNTSKKFISQLPCEYYEAGFISNPNELSELYSCCDCFIMPSLIENFSYTIYESLSCETPVLCFDVGGNNDLVRHKKNGYLAKPYDINDMLTGLDYCMNHKNELISNCLKTIELCNTKTIASKYIKIYNASLENCNEI